MIEVMVENVPHWVREKAHDVANAYKPPNDDEDASMVLNELVHNELDLFASDRATGLAIIAYYDWHGAMVGECDFEESPWRQFEDEVKHTAQLYLEDEGYEFD